MTGSKRQTVLAHRDRLKDEVFSPDGRFLATSASDGSLRLWDVAAARPLHEWKTRCAPRGAFAFSPDGRLMLVIDADGAALWDTKSLEKVRDLHGYSGLADFVLFNPSDQRVLIAMNADSGSGRLWFWDVASGRKLSVIGKEQTPAVTCGVFFPDGKQVLLGATDGKARLWDIASGKCVQQFPCHYISRSVALLPGLKQAMTDSTDDALRLWDIVTGDELVRVSRLEGEKGWIAITPEGLADGTPELLDRPVFRVGAGRMRSSSAWCRRSCVSRACFAPCWRASVQDRPTRWTTSLRSGTGPKAPKSGSRGPAGQEPPDTGQFSANPQLFRK